MRLKLGYGGKLLAAPLLLGANITNSWIKHVWQSTQESGVTISTDFADLPLQRHGDVKLMHLFVQNGWKQPALQNLNHCRMYLKVFRLSDIVTGSGESIAQQFWARPHPEDSIIQWPKTMAPILMAWNLWHQALTSVLHLGCNQRLAIPLGRWFVQSQPSGWYYFHPPTSSLWEVQGTQWIQHGGIPHHTRQISFHAEGKSTTPPPLSTLAKATITKTGQKLLLTGFKECDQSPTGVDPCHQLCSAPFLRQWQLQVQLEGSQ